MLGVTAACDDGFDGAIEVYPLYDMVGDRSMWGVWSGEDYGG